MYTGDDKKSSNFAIVNTFPSNQVLLGVITIALPSGSIFKKEHFTDVQIDKSLPLNTSLLSKLCGNGAQNLLLNAFSGQSQRRMYSRIICGPSDVQPCELLCEFGYAGSNSSQTGFLTPEMSPCQTAKIHLLSIPSLFNNFSLNNDLTFNTRHNGSGNVIYLDARSIPYLGHFPSELTGKLLIQFLHKEDWHILKKAEMKLLHSREVAIVNTTNLRFISHSGHYIRVNSEWSGYVNPWNKTLEMVVGKHRICDDYEQLSHLLKDEGVNVLADPINPLSSPSPNVFQSSNSSNILTTADINKNAFEMDEDDTESITTTISPQQESRNETVLKLNPNALFLNAISSHLPQAISEIVTSTSTIQYLPLRIHTEAAENKRIEIEKRLMWQDRISLLQRHCPDFEPDIFESAFMSSHSVPTSGSSQAPDSPIFKAI
uniref:PAS domain-containing protein n=1 Tax=Rhabditophanes sp. KR3021 TaxID=114890 RepID=A0AC35U7Q7_9BILA